MMRAFPSDINPAAEQLLAIVECEDLPARQATLRIVEGDRSRTGVGGVGSEVESDARVTIAHAALEATGRRDGFTDPTERMDPNGLLKQPGRVRMIERHQQRAIRGAFADDHKGLVVGV